MENSIVTDSWVGLTGGAFIIAVLSVVQQQHPFYPYPSYLNRSMTKKKKKKNVFMSISLPATATVTSPSLITQWQSPCHHGNREMLSYWSSYLWDEWALLIFETAMVVGKILFCWSTFGWLPNTHHTHKSTIPVMPYHTGKHLQAAIAWLPA